MTVNEDVLVAYALGTLTPGEAQEVERYLDAHPEAASTVLTYLDALSMMVTELEPVALPDDTEAKLLTRLRDDTQSSSWRWWLGAGMAAKVAAGLWLLRPTHDYEVRRLLDHYARRPGAKEEILTGTDGKPVGTLVRLPDNRLFVAFYNAPGDQQVYQAWETMKTTRSLGSWQGYTFLTEPLAVGSTLIVTLEPLGGSSQPTGEPLVLVSL